MCASDNLKQIIRGNYGPTFHDNIIGVRVSVACLPHCAAVFFIALTREVFFSVWFFNIA